MIDWNLKSRRYRPIGLDIGHTYIKMLQLEIHKGHISVAAARKINISSENNQDHPQKRNNIVSGLRRGWEEGGFRGKRVVSCLTNDRLKMTSLRLPQQDDSEIQQALEREVRQRFGLEKGKDSLGYVEAGCIRQGEQVKKELILFAADQQTVKEHIDMIQDANMVPEAIDSIPCALFRSFERSLRRQEDREKTMVFVDIGSHFTTVVFGYGGEITFVKQIAIGGNKFDEAIAAKLGIGVKEAQILRNSLQLLNSQYRKNDDSKAENNNEKNTQQNNTAITSQNAVPLDAPTRQAMVSAVEVVAEELAREISLCFRYYTVTFRGRSIERAVFTGGEAYENILINMLQKRLSVEVQVAQPLRGFDITDIDFDSDRRGWLCEWAVAVGLSLKGWNGYSKN